MYGIRMNQDRTAMMLKNDWFYLGHSKNLFGYHPWPPIENGYTHEFLVFHFVFMQTWRVMKLVFNEVKGCTVNRLVSA